MKEKLKRGDLTLGAWITIGHPDIAEIMANAGFDWLLFDTEHSPLNIEIVQNQLQAMSNTETVPIIRVAWNDMVLIKRALDIGAYGVVIPWVNNREDAKNAVRYCRYPTEGLRGVGPRRAARYGLDSEYLLRADEEILIVAQIETREAVDNIEDIVSVEGIDATFIGPSDLSASLGLMGQPFHPKVIQAIEKVLDACLSSGVAAGLAYAQTIEELVKFIRMGFRFVGATSDMGLLLGKSMEVLKDIKERLKS